MENFEKLKKLNDCSLYYKDYIKNKATIRELTNKNNSILILSSKLVYKYIYEITDIFNSSDSKKFDQMSQQLALSFVTPKSKAKRDFNTIRPLAKKIKIEEIILSDSDEDAVLNLQCIKIEKSFSKYTNVMVRQLLESFIDDVIDYYID